VGEITEGAAKRIIHILAGAEILAGPHSPIEKYFPRVMGEAKIRTLFLSEEWELEDYNEGLRYAVEQQLVKRGQQGTFVLTEEGWRFDKTAPRV
jgi:hypothetical protein